MDYTQLKTNPSNPRTITTESFDKLKNSIVSFTKMLVKRPIAYDSDGIIWGGNMRFMALTALVNDGKAEYKPEFFTELTDYTLFEKKQFAILDNSPKGISGEWDDDKLANEWSDLPLQEWGISTGGWDKENADYDEMWKGMPEFGGMESGIFKSLIVHFASQEDFMAFAKLVNQRVTDATKYIWYPFHEKTDIKSMSIEGQE